MGKQRRHSNKELSQLVDLGIQSGISLQRWQAEERPNQSLMVWGTNVLKEPQTLGDHDNPRYSTFEHFFFLRTK